MIAAILALVLQQTSPAAAGEAVWLPPQPTSATQVPASAPTPAIPDTARTDPFGYERAQCSPLIRSAAESLEVCQARVRAALAAHLGDQLPAGMAQRPASDTCRREAAGDRYAVQCGTPERSGPAAAPLEERVCETRPTALPGGGVAWTDECRPASGRKPEQEGLTFRMGGRDGD